MLLVGVDVGGTFTDLVLYDSERYTTTVVKVPTTPDDPSVGVRAGVDELLQMADINLGDVDLFSHGATIATNALLEGNGARVGMITTEGYRDIVHIGRAWKPHNYSVTQSIPWQARPLVRRRFRQVVTERIGATGEVLIPLDNDEVRTAAGELKRQGVEAVAICFLFSYLNPEHERRARKIVEETFPEAFISTSAETVSEFREFERFTTTCANAFVGPRMRSYLQRLTNSLKEAGLRHPLHIMRSNGGVATSKVAGDNPVSTVLSGPAAGVIGGAWVGDNSKRTNVISFDVGGTSSDIGIVTEGRMVEAKSRESWIAGFPFMVPIIDLHTIGAGGGSIAHVDVGGSFRVGPRSAGANPGPACYGLGGRLPTVTDAHLVLRRLDPEHALGGRLILQEDPATKAVSELGLELGLDPLEAAEGILRVINHNMANAIRIKTIEKGIDPRDYALVAMGGAGPLHAADVASLLDIPEIIVPPFPGITSAMGLLATDLKYDLSTTVFLRSDRVRSENIVSVFQELEEQGQEMLTADGFSKDSRGLVRRLDCRYMGQGYELSVDLSNTALENIELEEILATFHSLHEREYGHFFPETPVEIVTVRVTAVGRMPKLHKPELRDHMRGDMPKYHRDVHYRMGESIEVVPTPFYDRDALPVGMELVGPGVIVQEDATTVIPPGFTGMTEESGNLILRSSTSDAGGLVSAEHGRREA